VIDQTPAGSESVGRDVASATTVASAKPVLVVVHTPAPHRPAQPAPQFMHSFSDRVAPRTPSWNHIGQDKHAWLSTLAPMNSTMVEYVPAPPTDGEHVLPICTNPARPSM
jgi:hypothetical protein